MLRPGFLIGNVLVSKLSVHSTAVTVPTCPERPVHGHTAAGWGEWG